MGFTFFQSLPWVQLAVTFALIYFPSIAIHRLFFHPLARFPGPKLAAVSRWYEAYYDVICDGQYTFKIAELHKKYGIQRPAYFDCLCIGLLTTDRSDHSDKPL